MIYGQHLELEPENLVACLALSMLDMFNNKNTFTLALFMFLTLENRDLFGT